MIDYVDRGRVGTGRRNQKLRRPLLAALIVLMATAILGLSGYAAAAPTPTPAGTGPVRITVEIGTPSAGPSPTGSPSASPSPTVSASPTGSPSTSPTAPAPGAGGNLPRTGLPLLFILGAGTLLLMVGLGLRVLARRRTA
ncbi:hypothetical protein AB0J90_09675 [Micromonospora sp. NPDC049523]|uniref:hypothetical protein n=1 Tax=Micromonospora sp. NPDC049523 TaxID=3155921 RepID=UPI003416C861